MIRAYILAGGLGTRLRPLTDKIPKPMVKINNKPVLEHIIDNLNKHGITEIMVKVHYKAEVIMKYFGDRVIYHYEDKLLDAEDSIVKVEEWLGDEFLICNGDTVTDLDITRLIEIGKELHIHKLEFQNPQNGHYAGTMFINKFEMRDPNGESILAYSQWDGDGAFYLDMGDHIRLAKARKFMRKHK